MKAIRLLGFWICLLLGLALAALAQRAPPPQPATAPPDAFSATRAMADVRTIALRPHPTGSTDIVRVRDHLMGRITALGLELTVRPGEGYVGPRGDGRSLIAGSVQNVIGVLPGQDRRKPAVLVMSHYDSVANSPGAADDAAGVATALEVARALKAGPPPARDVIFLFTDGEEQGLLGAEAFFARDPLRERVGMVINMEARGDSGRAAMFQTGPGNGALMALFAREAHRPAANSLAAAVYEKMPNDTDFTHAVKAGLPGLNFAFIDDQLAYHTPLARADHLDQGSLQHLGDQVLPTVRALATSADLPAKAPNAVYSDLFGLVMVSYPAPVAWGLLALAGVLVLYALVRGLMIRGTSAVELLKGLCGFLLVGVSGGLVLHLAGKLLGIADVQAHYALLGRFDPLLLGCTALLVGTALAVVIGQAKGAARIWPSLLALAAGGVCCLIGGPPALDPIGLGLGVAAAVLVWASLGKPVGVLGAWIGALFGLLILAIATMVLLPGGSVMTTWPLLVAALAAVLVLAKGGTRNKKVALALTFFVALAAVAVVAQVGAWGGWTFAGLGVGLPAVLAAFGLLALPALIPLAHDFSALKLAAIPATLVVGLGAGLVAYAVLAGASPARPELTEAAHLSDLSTGRAWRISTLPRLDAWSRGALTAQGGTPTQGELAPFFRSKAWLAEARPVPLDPPQLVVEQAGERLLARVIPGPGAEYVTLRIKADGMLAGARLNGRPVPLTTKPGEWSSLTYHAPDPNGVTLSFSRLNGTGRVEAAALEVREGWPRAAPSPGAKPEGLMGWGISDKTLVLTRASVKW
ncbi:M20/M25/M40 family metallo-hydrolase [Caulobacter hibisci]|uniref:M20/M25/M40 family metallo-hydrolase n=1 Tax=Caulobacter hibisci TaxID=2035993 RepID=A0ABS0T358_9CAUL|nr:M20/M25/M40 family metallo-hydrolase [Caulobacter hibisci]MBI1685921.1 M20/M25/M40 family metallo-hydrolase [Caulobacter hibisci]